jgi:hypothetical protein
MKSVVRPELPTAAAGSSQAPTAAVDNSAPLSTHPEPTYKSRKTVQLTGTTSVVNCWRCKPQQCHCTSQRLEADSTGISFMTFELQLFP